MRPLTSVDILGLWERCAHLHPIDRALQVLASAFPEHDPDELARLPLGRRDALLLAVRSAALGDRLDAQDSCSACGARIELDLACSKLIQDGGTPPCDWSLECGGYCLTLRPLDSYAAAAAAQATDVESARAALLARSVVAAAHDGATVAVEHLPTEVGAAVATSIAEHDAGAELMLEFTCPVCAHAWRSVLDVARFVWTELAAHAQRLFLDVHTLAHVYGWHETDILAMSEARRRTYIKLASA